MVESRNFQNIYPNSAMNASNDLSNSDAKVRLSGGQRGSFVRKATPLQKQAQQQLSVREPSKQKDFFTQRNSKEIKRQISRESLKSAMRLYKDEHRPSQDFSASKSFSRESQQ